MKTPKVCSTVSPDTSRETATPLTDAVAALAMATPLTDGCNNERMVR